MQAAWDATTLRLPGAPGVQQQAAALLMRRHSPGSAPQAPAMPSDSLAKLVTLALGSADPRVLQWAVRACGVQRQNPVCQGLSARAWLNVEPSNLLAWLPLLAQEPPDLDEARQGMALATRVDAAWMRPVKLVLDARPADLTPAPGLAFDIQLIALGATDPTPAWQPLSRACSKPQVADPRRRGQCLEIARLLVEQGRDLLTFATGEGMGKRRGWPAQREQECQALMGATAQIGLRAWAPGISPDCQSRIRQHHLLQVDSLGEVGQAHQHLRANTCAPTPARQHLRANALAASAKASASTAGATPPVR